MMYPLRWSWEKALPPELPRRPKGRKQGTRSLIRSRRTPVRSKHSLHFSTKTLKCHRKRLRVYPFWTPYGHLGAKIRPNISLGAFQKESEISSFFVTRLGAKLAQKDPLNGLAKMSFVMFFGTCFQDGSKRPPGCPPTPKTK